jgi:hypothetical protein
VPYADWYKPHASNFACNQHPGPPNSLVKLVAEYTHIAEIDVRHMLDRLRHLGYCIGEPGAMTLLRLQPGPRQVVKDRSVADDW